MILIKEDNQKTNQQTNQEYSREKESLNQELESLKPNQLLLMIVSLLKIIK